MERNPLPKEKWTLSFDASLKSLLIRAAERRGIYPVALLEQIVRERFNPYGHADLADSADYVATLRKQSRKLTDEEFLAGLPATRRPARTAAPRKPAPARARKARLPATTLRPAAAGPDR